MVDLANTSRRHISRLRTSRAHTSKVLHNKVDTTVHLQGNNQCITSNNNNLCINSNMVEAAHPEVSALE